MASSLTVEIVTNERIVFSETDVEMVSAPGIEGMLGILPNHAPLVTTLSAGELRIKKGGAEQSMVVFGGFMEVLPNKVIVLADVAEKVEEIDMQRAEDARRRAEEAIARGGERADLAAAEARLSRAQVRIKFGQRRSSRRPSDVQ
ncbi:MAG: F0F1 ATP synthase subunit epsilon [Thermomicrobiales bacterium]|nr:MAG: F0F1 ATP synthase subunit epsilon [Thermomicrobiales bacterium]